MASLPSAFRKAPADGRREILHLNRLDQDVVHTRIQAVLFYFRAGMGGQSDDEGAPRSVFCFLFADRAGRLDAVSISGI
jgi:hypothetical protein